MEVVLAQSQITSMDKGGNVVVDIENLIQATDKCSGSPKMTKALSRKGSCRMERRSVEEQETEDPSKKFVVKVVCSQLDQLKQPMVPSKALVTSTAAATIPSHTEAVDGRSKRSSNHPTSIHPRKILLLFASMSSVGTMILIYFTLAINRRGGA